MNRTLGVNWLRMCVTIIENFDASYFNITSLFYFIIFLILQCVVFPMLMEVARNDTSIFLSGRNELLKKKRTIKLIL